MKTAAAFAKGLLELEGQLTPILASLVTIEEKNRQMLDHGGNKQVKEDLDRCVCASLSVCVCVCVCVCVWCVWCVCVCECLRPYRSY